MDAKVVKTCVICNTDKRIEIIDDKLSECRTCNIKSVLKHYFLNKVELLQKRRFKYAIFKDLDNRITALE